MRNSSRKSIKDPILINELTGLENENTIIYLILEILLQTIFNYFGDNVIINIFSSRKYSPQFFRKWCIFLNNLSIKVLHRNLRNIHKNYLNKFPVLSAINPKSFSNLAHCVPFPEPF